MTAWSLIVVHRYRRTKRSLSEPKPELLPMIIEWNLKASKETITRQQLVDPKAGEKWHYRRETLRARVWPIDAGKHLTEPFKIRFWLGAELLNRLVVSNAKSSIRKLLRWIKCLSTWAVEKRKSKVALDHFQSSLFALNMIVDYWTAIRLKIEF